MDKASESLLHSALHDMANVLAGIRSIVDLSDPGQPLTQRDRERLEAVLEEGGTTLGRCRSLAMESLPDAALEPGDEWRERLLEEIMPLATLYRRELQLDFAGASHWDQWPGPRLRALAHALTRQLLPYARTGPVAIRCEATGEEWRIRWSPVAHLPEQLAEHLTGTPADRPTDICGRWAAAVASGLGATAALDGGGLQIRIPRTR